LASHLYSAGAAASFISALLSAPSAALGISAGIAVSYGGSSLNYIDSVGGNHGDFFYGWSYTYCFLWWCTTYWYGGGVYYNPVVSGY